MVVSDLLRALLVGYLLFRLLTGLPAPVEMVIFTLLISTVEAFRQPAGGSILPMIVDKEQYNEAVFLSVGMQQRGRVGGTGRRER